MAELRKVTSFFSRCYYDNFLARQKSLCSDHLVTKKVQLQAELHTVSEQFGSDKRKPTGRVPSARKVFGGGGLGGSTGNHLHILNMFECISQRFKSFIKHI